MAITESKFLQIWSGTITITAFVLPAYTADSPISSDDLSYDTTNWMVTSALLAINATQSHVDVNVAGPPKISTKLNGVNISPLGQISWGVGDTGSMSVQSDISSKLLNGSNTFQFEYNIPDGIEFGGSAQAHVTSASLTIVYTYIGTATTPPNNPSPAPESGATVVQNIRSLITGWKPGFLITSGWRPGTYVKQFAPTGSSSSLGSRFGLQTANYAHNAGTVIQYGVKNPPPNPTFGARVG